MFFFLSISTRMIIEPYLLLNFSFITKYKKNTQDIFNFTESRKMTQKAQKEHFKSITKEVSSLAENLTTLTTAMQNFMGVFTTISQSISLSAKKLDEATKSSPYQLKDHIQQPNQLKHSQKRSLDLPVSNDYSISSHQNYFSRISQNDIHSQDTLQPKVSVKVTVKDSKNNITSSQKFLMNSLPQQKISYIVSDKSDENMVGNPEIRELEIKKQKTLRENNQEQKRDMMDIYYRDVLKFQKQSNSCIQQIAKKIDEDLNLKLDRKSKKLNIDRRFREIVYDPSNIDLRYEKELISIDKSHILGQNSNEKAQIKWDQLKIIPNILSWPSNMYLVQICTGIIETSFNLYYSHNMDFSKVKIHCSENLLGNILSFIRQYNLSIQYIRDIDKVVQKGIIPYIKYKYPHSQEKIVSKKLSDLVQKVDYFDENQNDIIFMSGVNFEYQNTEYPDYSPEIVKVLDAILDMPDKEFNLNFEDSVFQAFQNYIENLYSKIFKQAWVEQRYTNKFQYVNQWNSFLKKKQQIIERQQAIKQEQNFHRIANFSCDDIQNECQSPSLKNLKKIYHELNHHKMKQHNETGKSNEYKERVKSYSELLLGRKISKNISRGTQLQRQHIFQGNQRLKIKDAGLSRIITKWCGQLEQQYFSGPEYIMDRSTTFRCLYDNTIIEKYLPQNIKKRLVQLFMEEAEIVKAKKKQMMDRMYEFMKETIQRNLSKYLVELCPKRQAQIGTFSAVIIKAKQNYLLGYLNILIHSVLKVEKRFQQQELWSKPSLVTLKLGDLIRCKITSQQSQIVALYNELMKQSEKNNDLKVIRIKNRLSKGNKDLLINIRFGEKNPIIAEIQLAIKSEMTDYLKKADTFSHYLYEIMRNNLGAINQLCTVWSKFDERFLWYENNFHQINNKIFGKKHKNIHNSMHQDQGQVQNYPFWCSSCDKMQTSIGFVGKNTFCEKNQLCTIKHSRKYYQCGRCNYLKPLIRQKIILKKQKSNVFKEIKFIPSMYPFYVIDISSKKMAIMKLQKCQIQKKTFLFLLDSQKQSIHYYKSLDKQEDNEIFMKNHIILNLIEQQNCKQRSQQFSKWYNLALEKYYIPKIIQKISTKRQPSLQLQGYDLPSDFSNVLANFEGKLNHIRKIRLQNTGIEDLGLLCKTMPNITQIIIKQKKKNLKNFPPILLLKPSLIQVAITNNLVKTPSQIFELSSLRFLVLTKCHLQEIPADIKKLSSLQELAISDNDLTQLPKEIGELKKLQKLYISRNKIKCLPEELKSLQSLQYLMFSANKIDKVPDCVKKLKQLTLLEASQNKLKFIPYEIICLPKIKNLFFIHDSINFISINKQENKIKDKRSIQSNLETMNFCNNNLKKFPILFDQNMQEAYEWKHIKVIQLQNNKIQYIPLKINEVQSLQLLDLSYNQIRQIPKALSGLKLLQKLFLGHNRISQLPNNIGDLQNLVLINLNNNLIQILPSSFYQLKQLIHVNLRKNMIKEILQEIVELSKLEILYLDYNQLFLLPINLSKLCSLKILTFNGNKINWKVEIQGKWKQSWKNMQELEYLGSDDNVFPIQEQSMTVIEQNLPNILKKRVKLIDKDHMSIQSLTNNQKNYCGKLITLKKNENQTQGTEQLYCGPSQGINCECCIKLDIQQRGFNLNQGMLVNAYGNICKLDKQTDKIYCGNEVRLLIEQILQIQLSKGLNKPRKTIQCKKNQPCKYCLQLNQKREKYGLYKSIM